VPDETGRLTEVPDSTLPVTGDALTDLLGAILAVASELDLPAVLERFVQVSAELTRARYGAINVLDPHGTSTTFVFTGVPTAVAAALRTAPHAQGVLGQIPSTGVLRLADLREHPAFRGFPREHPPMGSFLGASVRVGPKVFGQLYLSEKAGGFTQDDEDVVLALAAAAGVAVANAQLYAEAERREHWLRAGQAITTMLLEDIDEEEALDHIASTAREVARADTAALVLPGLGGELLVELAVGYESERILGARMPRGGRAWTVMAEGKGLTLPSLSAARRVAVPEMRAFGPALYAPLRSAGEDIGVLILLRRIGGPPFDDGDLATAESFAAQAALAYVLAGARHAQDVAALLEERERIARDLHDLAIQQLFATGMQLETVRRRAARGVDATELLGVVDEALENVDGSVREIRHIVYALRDPDGGVGVVARLLREVDLARTGLGFAPTFVAVLDGATVTAGEVDEDRLDERVHGFLASDVVAVVREALANAARHAHASTVEVRLTAGDSDVLLEVQDDGVGIRPDPSRRSGTANLASRARARGGSFSIAPVSEGGGTLLSWSAPLA